MKYLFISTHVDDVDLMAGGTVAKMVELGHEIQVVSLSSTYEGVNLVDEWTQSMEVLGVKYGQTQNFIPRFFYDEANQILQYLFQANNHNFDYVFAPSIDYHSDHTVVAKAALRAFKHRNLLAYTPEWNERKFIKNYFVKLEDRHVQKKLNALKCYKSQQDRPYFKEEYLLGSLHVNGMMANCKYAEAFQVINMNA